jgi:hypothetical protein
MHWEVKGQLGKFMDMKPKDASTLVQLTKAEGRLYLKVFISDGNNNKQQQDIPKTLQTILHCPVSDLPTTY